MKTFRFSTGDYLSVDVPPQRARSAEMILLVPDDEERRRASFELYKKTSQRRRLLPDIEQLKKVSSLNYCKNWDNHDITVHGLNTLAGGEVNTDWSSHQN